MRSMTAAALLLLVVGCASAPQPPNAAGVVGTAAEQQALAGLWRGTIDAKDPQVSGPIEFRLQPGEVFFLSAARTPRRKIAWVRVNQGKVTGATDTWFDPARNANVYTTFEAEVANGVMHGIVRDKVGTEWTDVATFTASRVAD